MAAEDALRIVSSGRGTDEVIGAVVWISDLRNFAQLSETLGADRMITALNDYRGRPVGSIQPFGGGAQV
jgi:class 3 adenylate cyclase